MNLTFIPGAVGFGLKNEHAADIDVFGCKGGIISCVADDKETALALREHVLGALQPAKSPATIQMGNIQLSVPEDSDMTVSYKGAQYRFLDLLAKAETMQAETLQAEIDQLRQQLHDHDRRRDASMELARTLAEGHKDDPEPAGCRECFGFEHLDCICHDDTKPCMDIDGANLVFDSGDTPA